MKRSHLAIEAVVLAVPGFAIGALGILIFLSTGASMLGYRPLDGAQGIALALGLIVSLWQYTTLALRTVIGQRYEFRLMFWVAAFSGALGVWYVIKFFGLALGSAIAAPMVVASVHFIWLQLKRRHER